MITMKRPPRWTQSCVSRRAKPASDWQVKTSHFEKGKIRPTHLLAAKPQKEARSGESTQDGESAVDTLVTCARLAAAADRSGTGHRSGDGPEIRRATILRGKISQCADRLGRVKPSHFSWAPGC